MDSILDTVKYICNITPDCTDFDVPLILHTNSIISTVNQFGVGKEGFEITGNTETWNDFLGEETVDTKWVKSYIPLRVWLIFDANGITASTKDAIKEEIRELEFRFFIEKDNEEE